jgi:hypothetical protein
MYYGGLGRPRTRTPPPPGPTAAAARCTWCWHSGAAQTPTRHEHEPKHLSTSVLLTPGQDLKKYLAAGETIHPHTVSFHKG